MKSSELNKNGVALDRQDITLYQDKRGAHAIVEVAHYEGKFGFGINWGDSSGGGGFLPARNEYRNDFIHDTHDEAVRAGRSQIIERFKGSLHWHTHYRNTDGSLIYHDDEKRTADHLRKIIAELKQQQSQLSLF